jgi:hypothetical protein
MSRVRSIVWAVWCGVLAGCAGTPRPADLPDDFAVSVSFSGTPDGPCAPAWFLVEPDGSLRAAQGERRATSPLPPAVRVLRRGEVREVWTLTSRLGVLGGAPPGEPAGDDLLPPPGVSVAVVSVAAEGRRRTVRVIDPQANGEFSALAGRLRALAWFEGP